MVQQINHICMWQLDETQTIAQDTLLTTSLSKTSRSITLARGCDLSVCLMAALQFFTVFAFIAGWKAAHLRLCWFKLITLRLYTVYNPVGSCAEWCGRKWAVEVEDMPPTPPFVFCTFTLMTHFTVMWSSTKGIPNMLLMGHLAHLEPLSVS